jgi:hypothetical protein
MIVESRVLLTHVTPPSEHTAPKQSVSQLTDGRNSAALPGPNKLWVTPGAAASMPRPGRVIVNRITFADWSAGYIEIRTNTDG